MVQGRYCGVLHERWDGGDDLGEAEDIITLMHF